MITLMNAVLWRLKKSKRQISFSRQSLAGGGCLGYFDKSFLGKKGRAPEERGLFRNSGNCHLLKVSLNSAPWASTFTW